MADHVRFLEALSPDPRVDLNRLVYADWLEEQGHPLGELLRLQVEIARRGEGDSKVPVLHMREMTLLAAHEPLFYDLAEEFGPELAARDRLHGVIALSRRDPVAFACPACGDGRARRWSAFHPVGLNWRLNPMAAIPELLFGVRLPRVTLVCKGCWEEWARCAACRVLLSVRRWHELFRWDRCRCPHCDAEVQVLHNAISGGVLGLGSLAGRGLAALLGRGRS